MYVETSNLTKSTKVEIIYCNYYMDERIHGKAEVSGSSPDRGSISKINLFWSYTIM